LDNKPHNPYIQREEKNNPNNYGTITINRTFEKLNGEIMDVGFTHGFPLNISHS
jgi:hypothetical protein